MKQFDIGQQWPTSEDVELVRRLEGLEWPGVNADVRTRCWEEFSRKLVERDAPVRAAHRAAEPDLHAFSRRVPSGLRPVLAARVAAGAGLTRRAGLRRPLISAA